MPRSKVEPSRDRAVEIAKEMRKLGYECSARLVRRVAAHDDWENTTPLPHHAALAANILAALAAEE